MNAALITFRVVVVCWFVMATLARSETTELSGSARQWQTIEFSFGAETEVADPFDFERVRFSATFVGPEKKRMEVPGFWDGERAWKIRFTPPLPGEWSYVTSFSNDADAGLHQRRGRFRADAPDTTHAVRRHGGFLKVSDDRQSLTFTDGTPFFWLGDTWWAAPSAAMPFENFRRAVDARVAQGYTVFQAHGHRPLFPDEKGAGMGALEATRQPDAETLRYWREVDRYYAYADEKGLVGAVGFAAANLLDRHSLPELKRLWHYYIARYGAYPLTFLITQEYNMHPDERAAKIPELIALGQFIKDTDPWKRAITAHAWVHSRDRGQAWNEPWLDFIMLQAGHRRTMSGGRFYRSLWPRTPAKPFLEAEANYEGFASDTLTVDAARIRDTAYVAMQCGSLGFTYGAQGLYAAVLDRAKPGPTAKWGPVKTWEEGLGLPGGTQMQHLRACYESVEWWKLQPIPNAVEPVANLFVKANGTQAALLYFPSKVRVAPGTRFTGLPATARYAAEWFDPRTGKRTQLSTPLTADAKGLELPSRPDEQDWMLILRREKE